MRKIHEHTSQSVTAVASKEPHFILRVLQSQLGGGLIGGSAAISGWGGTMNQFRKDRIFTLVI